MPPSTPDYRTPLARRPREVPFWLWAVLALRGPAGLGGVVLLGLGALLSAGLGTPWDAIDAVCVAAGGLGLGGVGYSVLRSLGFVELLRVGRETEAWMVDSTLGAATEVRPGSPLEKWVDIPDWMMAERRGDGGMVVELVEVRFQFEDHRGQHWPLTVRTTEAHRVTDEVTERVLYDPDSPRRAVLLDALPRFLVPTARGWAAPPLAESLGVVLLLAVPPVCLVLGRWLAFVDVVR